MESNFKVFKDRIFAVQESRLSKNWMEWKLFSIFKPKSDQKDINVSYLKIW
jgi:hypothetical protein